MPGSASVAKLNQKEYADWVGVTPSRISRATKEGGVVQGKYVPAWDVVVRDSDGKLLGYQEPVERDVSPGDTSSESARKAAGVSSEGSNASKHGMGNRGHGRARGNPSDSSRSTGQAQSGGQSQKGSGLEEALEKAGETAGAQAARSPGILRGLLRLGGAALGAILGAELVGRQAGPVLIGTAIGGAITEYAIRAEQNRPQEPTRQIQPEGLWRPLRDGLLPGMSRVGSGQEQMRGQFPVEKTPLARGRPVGTRAASRRAGRGHKQEKPAVGECSEGGRSYIDFPSSVCNHQYNKNHPRCIKGLL